MTMSTEVAAATIVASIAGAIDVRQVDHGIEPLRLPLDGFGQHPDENIGWMASYPAGVRLEFETRASVIELDVTLSLKPSLDIPPPRIATFHLEGRAGILATYSVPINPLRAGLMFPHVRVILVAPPAEASRHLTIWLPHNMRVTLHSVRADAPVTPAAPSLMPRWLHHGSSISHGMETESPLGTWPRQSARALGLDLTDLAFAGQALLDPFVARAIAREAADIITLKLGINVVNAASMTARSFAPALHGFLDIVRESHPDVPLVVITALLCPIHETRSGPLVRLPSGELGAGEWGGNEGLTLQHTRSLVREAVSARGADANIAVLDGMSLLGASDEHVLFDMLHPDQSGHDLIAARFVEAARSGTVAHLFAQVLR